MRNFRSCGRRTVAMLTAVASCAPAAILAASFGGPIRSGLAEGTTAAYPSELTGDGVLDLLTVNTTLEIVSVRPGNGDGTFRQAINTPAPRVGSSAVGDMNGDGRADVVYTHARESSLAVMFGRGDGTFGPATVYLLPTNDPGYPNIVIADLDGDGDADIIAPDNRTAIVVLLNLGDGTLGEAASYESCCEPLSVAVADFDGDGIPDVASANRNDGSVGILRNRGDGTFAETSYVDFPYVFQGVSAGDFDGDGRTDLVVMSYTAGVDLNNLLFGNGDGTFRGPVPFPQLLPGRATPVVADFDGDGALDLATYDTRSVDNSNDVAILFGEGDGTFRAETSFAAGARPVWLAVGDFDADGAPDLVTVNGDSNDLTVLPNETPQIAEIRAVAKPGRPLRIKILGSSFRPGAQVFVGASETPWLQTTVKSDGLVVLKGGEALAERFPEGVAVPVLVRNADGTETRSELAR